MNQEDLKKLEEYLTVAMTRLANCKVQLIRRPATDKEQWASYFPNEVVLTDFERQQIQANLMYARSIVYREQAKDKAVDSE